MFSKKTVLALFSAVVLLSLLAAQCGAPATPQTVVEKVSRIIHLVNTPAFREARALFK